MLYEMLYVADKSDIPSYVITTGNQDGDGYNTRYQSIS